MSIDPVSIVITVIDFDVFSWHKTDRIISFRLAISPNRYVIRLTRCEVKNR
jgi:hypothetical protein